MEDVHFADFIIADITAGLKNCMFAEIAPRTFYPLYGIAITVETFPIMYKTLFDPTSNILLKYGAPTWQRILIYWRQFSDVLLSLSQGWRIYPMRIG